ncbi:Transcription factor IIIA [Elsinoe australis]|uniref:Transcription factor IIIA n=1 Tax=Elsinoe australis TaxID=40998 RepID=A0A2P8ABE9_9PEZI|nr:Transcription factor IIIA [Elsinoe australis]
MSVLAVKRGAPPGDEEQLLKRARGNDFSGFSDLIDPALGGSNPDDDGLRAVDSNVDEDDAVSSSAITTQPGTPNLKHPRREKKFVCDYPNCGKAYTRPVRLSEHQRSHTNERPFVCTAEKCGKAFLRESHLKAHIKSHHEDLRDYICDWPDCGKGFATGQRLREHKKRHEEREQCKCTTCGQFFRKQETLDRHMSSVHTTDPGYICDHIVNEDTDQACGLKFNKYPALRQHRDRAHSGYKYFCHDCSPEGKDFEMDMDDSASQMPAVVGFLTFSELQRHMKDVHPPKCNICGQACSTAAKLKAHMDIEHQDLEERRTIPCKAAGCDHMFTRNGNMLVHYKSTHENQKFLCAHGEHMFNTIPEWNGSGACGRGFSTKAALEKHIRTQHLNLPLPANKGKEKRKARKARMAAVQEEDAAAMDEDRSQHSEAANLLTGLGHDEMREIRCVLEYCPHRFRRWYDLELHLGTAHGYSDIAASDAAEAIREREALSGGQFWWGGDPDDEARDVELATRLQAALGVQSLPGSQSQQ